MEMTDEQRKALYISASRGAFTPSTRLVSILRPFGPRCPAQDFDYLSRVATHVEALQRAEAGVSEATETKRTLLRCVSTCA